MIAGVGVDVVEIERVARALQKKGFLERVYTPQEQGFVLRKGAASAAGLFAAKEAVAKALGTGFTGGIRLLDIEIAHDESGAPRAALHGAALATCGGGRVLVSISHDGGRAIAFAVREREVQP